MTKKLWIINLFNSCGGGYGPYYSSIWHPSFPYSNQFQFSEGVMVEICLSSMHPTTLQILKEIRIIGLLPDVTERCYQVNVIYQISLI